MKRKIEDLHQILALLPEEVSVIVRDEPTPYKPFTSEVK